jgi:acyl-CoA synthetase (AMP-forming)/AMP-acid ligase II
MLCPYCMEHIDWVYTGGLIKYDGAEDSFSNYIFICDRCKEKLESLGLTIEYSELVSSGEGEWSCGLCGKSSTKLL